MPKASFVCPTYNGAGYLAETVESIRRQSVEDWELVIVDDDPEDRILEIDQAGHVGRRRSHLVQVQEVTVHRLPGGNDDLDRWFPWLAQTGRDRIR